ncbi:Clavaminate synthase-like protein [Gyrodon lividus]|nr:Clavaminate synthase-like protein [Gyrodon lividus]
MNSMHDSHKRTSISQLLNPSSDSSGYSHLPSLSSSPGVSQYQHPQHPPNGPYPQQPESGSSFHLRAANWEPVNDDQAAPKRRPDAGPTVARSYPMPPHMYAEMNGDVPPRQQRQRMDEHGNYPIPAGAWSAQPEVSTVPYGSSVVAPMYSDERTAISGDYTQNTFQNAERASVRVAARFTAPIPGQPVFEVGALMHPPPGMFSAMLYQHPPPSPQVQKRPSTDVEEAPSQKSKKAKKAKAADGNASSKRGYNARKRSEAAQIAAQNAQLMPTVSYASAPADKGKEQAGEAPMRIVTAENSGQGNEASAPLHPELQFARCMSNRYRSEQFPRCVSCTRRWAGDTCRFQGIRFFLKDNQRNIVGISFVENQRPDAPSMNFPVQWNVPLTEQHIRRTKRTIAQALLPTLRQELDHLAYPEIIRRTRESEVRATCDTCMTSIFSCSWMCRLCGREACAECFEQVKELTEDKPGATQAEIVALQARREKHAHTNPFFLSCTRRNEHHAKDFSPMSRFCKSELAQAIKDMDALLEQPDVDALPVIGAIDPALQNGQTQLNGTASGALNDPPTDPGNSETPAPSIQMALATIQGAEATAPASTGDQPSGTPTNTDLQSHPAAGPTESPELPFHPTTTIPDSELTEEVFRPLWSKGDPIVVTGLLPKFQIQWTPEYFLQKYNSQSCLVLECQYDTNKRVTVGEFFSLFGKYEGRVECWKLKDWPPSTDFKTAFPELFEDFSRAVPVPTYVRRDGALNIASHFPSNTVAPDLGPKMYNAMSSFESAGSKGSTRLHMDMADAINIMTSTAPTPDGKPGCAAWDLFRACDADKLRTFLRRKFKGTYQHDPIHSQQFYLDSTLRKELFDMYGIKSHRVYQKPGEAVLIPAGCAHQVCNLADCVKVAVDFVSPENIARCEQLTKEFREQNQSMAWKEDVLQLRTMMWFAWLSCCRQEKEMNET